MWRRVDFRIKPILLDDLIKYMKFLQPLTLSLAIRGDLSPGTSALTQNFFDHMRTQCNQLKELIIEEYYIHGDKVYFMTKILCHIFLKYVNTYYFLYEQTLPPSLICLFSLHFYYKNITILHLITI